MTPPTKYKDRADYTPDEHFNFKRTGKRPLTDEYRKHRNRVLEDAGLDDEFDDVPLADMSPADHHERHRRA